MTVSIRRDVAVDGRAYTVVDDRSLDLRALVAGRALDETTGRPPVERLRLRAGLRGIATAIATREGRLAVSAGEGGTFAVSGVIALAFPDLTVNSFTVDLMIGAAGYLETPVAAAVPAGTTAFPIILPDVLLRRPAIRLIGRVVTAGSAPSPVNGATVALIAPPGMIGFRAHLALQHDAPVSVRPVTLTPVLPDLNLMEDAVAGTRRLSLARRTALTASAVIRLGGGAEREYAVVQSIDGPADLARPGVVTLTAPVAFRHRVAEPAPRRVTAAPAAGTPLVERAFPGDQVIFVGNATLFLSDAAFLIDESSPARREYRVAAPPEDGTDADGYYRIGPIGRTQTVTVRVTPPATPALPDVVLPLDYNQPDNILNVRV